MPSWKTFIELSERRNLFVHCDGIVSSQYMSVCNEHGVEFKQPIKVGDELDVTPAYFAQALNCVLEIGLKLAHVLWRSVVPAEREEADGALVNTMYNLLISGQPEMTINIGDFAAKYIKKWHCDQSRRRAIVNLAQAYKWSNNNSECVAILDKEDWSSCGPEFQLAIAVLKDDFKWAQQEMKKLGCDGLEPEAYPYWPLFREFRKSPEFLEMYEEVFEKKFEQVSTKKRKVEVEATAKIVIEEMDPGSKTYNGPEYI